VREGYHRASHGDNGYNQDTPGGSGESHYRRFARTREGEPRHRHRCREHTNTSIAPGETRRPRSPAQQLPSERNEACT